VVENTVSNLNRVIHEKENIRRNYQKKFKDKNLEIELTRQVEGKELELVNDMIKEKKESGGYAFAEDDNRMAFEVGDYERPMEHSMDL
jgi:hypothetical protein